MLAILACQCATSELKARRVLRNVGIKNYLGVRCYLGKISIGIGLENMPEAVRNSTEWRALKDLINSKSSYSVIVGWDQNQMKWSDIYDGRIESVVPAEKIIEYFA